MGTPALSAPRARSSQRPRQLTAPTVRKICELIERGVPQAPAAGSLGIPRRTYQEWLEKGRRPDAREPYLSFAERIQEALDNFHASRAKIVGESNDDRTALEVLRRRFKDDWAEPERGSTVNISVTLAAERQDLASRLLAAAQQVLGDDPDRLEQFMAAVVGGDVIAGEAVEAPAELAP